MENQNTLNLLYADADYTVARVNIGTGTYACLIPLDDVYEEGDTVVVTRANGGTGTGYIKAIESSETINFTSDINYQWVIGKVNTDLIDAIQEREIKILKALARTEARAKLVAAVGELTTEITALIPSKKETE